MKSEDYRKARERLITLLAVQRLGFLRPAERLAVLGFLDSGVSLSVVSLHDLEPIIGRRLRERAWNGGSLLEAAEADALLLDRLGACFVSIEDEAYPAALRELPDPPFGLFLRGAFLPPDLPAIAIVGTRYPTGSGLVEAGRFAAALAGAGLPVVSGLARGIDSAAHRGALAAGGLTCAVLPCGLESCYPLSNRGLAATILEKGGLLVTEYPPGTEIRKHRFPERNRIITGLARGLLVVEAPAGSGALISADFALEQGREVYIAASRMGGARSAGLDLLAEEGAALLSSPGELLRDWGLAEPSAPGAATAEGRASETDWRGEGVEGASIEGSSMAAALRAELGMEGGAGSTRF